MSEQHDEPEPGWVKTGEWSPVPGTTIEEFARVPQKKIREYPRLVKMRNLVHSLILRLQCLVGWHTPINVPEKRSDLRYYQHPPKLELWCEVCGKKLDQ